MLFPAKSKQSSLLITNFKGYQDTLSFYLDKAYETIYKKYLFLYSLEGYTTTTDEMKDIIKEYDTLVIKLMGANMANEYIELMGKDTFFFTINQHLNEKFENDELKTVFNKDTQE